MNLPSPYRGVIRWPATQPAALQDWPAAAAAVANWCGFTPTGGYLLDEASGNALDFVGSNPLTPIDSPTRQVVQQGYPRKLGVTMVHNTGDSLDASASTVYNFAGSFAILLHCRAFSGSAVVRDLAAKHNGTQGADLDGYRLSVDGATGRPTWAIGDGTTEATVTIASDHSARGYWYLCTYDQTADEIGLYTELGSGTADSTGIADCQSTTVFALGSRNTFAAGADHAYLLLFSGAATESMDGDVIARVSRGPE